MLFDTTFLIHFQRELERSVPGPAHRFLDQHRDQPLHISVISVGEFAEGFQPKHRGIFWTRIKPYLVLGLDSDIAWEAGQLARRLRASNRFIGDNDLWIAATALHHNLPVVTRDADHFGRIEGLNVLTY